MAKTVKKMISIVVPVFCNADSLPQLIVDLEKEHSRNLEYSFEYVFVEDGSTDNSLGVLLDIKKSYGNKVRIVKLSRNFGQLAALNAGYAHSSGSLIITISADLQDRTSLITEMLEKSKEGFSVVICNRNKRSDSIISRLTSKIGYSLLRQRVSNIPSGGFDVFLITSEIKNHLLALRGRHSFLQGDILSMGHSLAFIGYHRTARPFGKSGYSFKRRVQYFIDAILDTSYQTIQTAIKFGLLIAVIGFFLASFIVYGKIVGKNPFSGFAIIASAIFIVGGTQIVITGLVGEYVWRIYDMTRNKPKYIVEDLL